MNTKQTELGADLGRLEGIVCHSSKTVSTHSQLEQVAAMLQPDKTIQQLLHLVGSEFSP